MTDVGTTERIEPAEGQIADQYFGLMRISGALLALPVLAIREVIRGQTTYGPMPVKAEGLIGAVDIRGTIIPILDLRGALGLPRADSDEHVIVIMRWRNHLLGLRACAVCGLARLRPSDLFALSTLTADVGGCLAIHAFKQDDEIATLLDARAIAELPNVPLVAEAGIGPAKGHVSGAESILLFQYGRSYFGIDATCVDATVPAVHIVQNALATGFCLGVIHHQGYEVPVVDTTEAIGLGPGRPAPETPVVVVRFGDDAMLGFAVDAVRDIVRVDGADIHAMPSVAPGARTLFRGMFSGKDGRQNLLLDADSLRAEPTLDSLARLRRPRLALDRGESVNLSKAALAVDASVPRRPFLTYVAGGEQATPLDQVTEILPYPSDVAPFEVWSTGMLGLFTHRGRVAPLMCLGTMLGLAVTIDPTRARILFVDHDGRAAGFVVESLRSIETASGPAYSADKMSEHGGIFGPLVVIGLGSEKRMIANIDLAAEIRRVYRDVAPASEPSAEPLETMPERMAAVA